MNLLGASTLVTFMADLSHWTVCWARMARLPRRTNSVRGAESSKFEEGRPSCYLSAAMAAR